MTEEKECRECRDWTGCYGKNYYLPGEIQFCRWQMMWLLWHLEELQSDIYPSLTSSYLNWPPNLAEGSRNGAYFETPRGLAAVITQRLDKTKKDGKLLLAEIKPKPLAKSTILNVEVKAQFDDSADALYRCYEGLDNDAKWALGYISGRWTKKEPYYHWRWRKQAEKVNKIIKK